MEHRNINSNEVVFTPPQYVAHLTAKSKYGRMGLSFLNAAKVHSGFVGRLALELVNLSNDRKPITIKRGDPFMHIEFITREGDSRRDDDVYTDSKKSLPELQSARQDLVQRRLSIALIHISFK
jgi:deoxycytidine triphosphate deaminase